MDKIVKLVDYKKIAHWIAGPLISALKYNKITLEESNITSEQMEELFKALGLIVYVKVKEEKK